MKTGERWCDLSEYKDKIDQMRWSYSRLSSFGNCKYEFYLNYILDEDTRNKVYSPQGNYYAEVGSFVHEILAKLFEKEITVEEAAMYYVDNYDSVINYKTRQSTMKKTFEACADYFSESDFNWIDNYEVLGVEMEIVFNIGKYQFVSYIDLLVRDKKDNKIIVIDHKSAQYPLKKDGNVKSNSKKSFESYKKQMYLYSYAVNEIYGEYPKEICWNHFKEGGKFVTIPFKKEEYDETIKWFKKTIKQIEKEEDFEPTLNFFYCTNLCNFRDSCEYSQTAEWK